MQFDLITNSHDSYPVGLGCGGGRIELFPQTQRTLWFSQSKAM
jgi:hypothetical protein